MKKDYGTIRRHLWALPFELFMAGGILVTLAEQNWQHFAAAVFTFTFSFAPLVFERLFRFRLSPFIQGVYVAFIFATVFSGEVLAMYARVKHWDDITHFTSGILIGIGVMLWMFMLSRKPHSYVFPTWLQSLLIICITMSIALFWEILEFGSDELLGTLSQDNLFDTMTDMIFGTLGGCIVAILAALQHKGRRVPGLDAIMRQARRLNP